MKKTAHDVTVRDLARKRTKWPLQDCCCIFICIVSAFSVGCEWFLIFSSFYMLYSSVFCWSVNIFQGHVNSTFYIKAALSPDDKYLLSGSSDGNVYIWRVDRLRPAARVLQGHVNEVTGVDWCRGDVGRIVTLSDDSVVWIWRVDGHREPSAQDGMVIGRTARTAKYTG